MPLAYLVDTYTEELIFKNWNIKPEEMEKVIGQSFDDIYANWVIWNTNQFQESGLQ